jgi:hypothetical protein
MTLDEITEALNNEVRRTSAPYTNNETEKALSILVAQKRIAQIDTRPAAYMAIAAKVVRCPNDHDIVVTYLLGSAETMQGVKCPICGVVAMVSVGQLVSQNR